MAKVVTSAGISNGQFCFVLRNSDNARDALGYAETVRQLTDRLAHCHPTNRQRVGADLDRARAGEGSTAFDWLVDTFKFRGLRLELQ
ncbi:hypothetical protein [Antrihabitans cavernicola]|uniref:hypothetical protein n=1 Tax=Antrihabitans cavernicola TaxID=2495913 RepID=UPI001F1E96A4|nr:hypothetical protein [Spelaeibacter cavernicola]